MLSRSFLSLKDIINKQGSSTLDTVTVSLIKWLLSPVVIVATLAGCSLFYGQNFKDDFLPLAIISFLLASHIFDEANLYRQVSVFPLFQAVFSTLLKWSFFVGCLWALAIVTDMTGQFPRKPLMAWFVVTPVALLVCGLPAGLILRTIAKLGGQRTAIIVGANPLGYELFSRITNDAYLGIRVLGFFDDRLYLRLPQAMQDMVLGKMDDILNYVINHSVDLVYISLPMFPHPRILKLIDTLGDSTASVYFIPDMSSFDLMNAHFGHVSGMPVVSIRDKPFFGVGGLVKRLGDILISSLILLMIFPLMALIAVGIKLSSHGPVLFTQRRYGLAGEEIKVYKFRTMTVAEDGDCIIQAKKNDHRVTAFGKFLRKTSFDELPQFINVLQGRMSVVGPRPHAVAHNEMYRKIIKGYMIRHKVKPGVTGWAQVNGLRGETDTLEKMAKRIEHDLEYIRNWSLMLDFWIILKTIKVFFVGGKNAF